LRTGPPPVSLDADDVSGAIRTVEFVEDVVDG
jgi:hypothetical protein